MRKTGWALLAFFLIMNSRATFAQSNDMDTNKLKEVISQHVKAGDNRDAAMFNKILNDNFRVTINGFRGQPGITIIDKKTYIGLMEGGRIGGDTRTHEIKDLNIKNNIASAKVVIEGTSVIFTSYYHFVKNEDESWQLIADMPFTEPK